MAVLKNYADVTKRSELPPGVVRPSWFSDKQIMEIWRNKKNQDPNFEKHFRDSRLVKHLFRFSDECYYTRKPYYHPDDYSFERVNPLEGYTIRNTKLSKRHINQLKGATLDKFIHEMRKLGLGKQEISDILHDVAKRLAWMSDFKR